MDEYVPRIVDTLIARRLRTHGAVLVEGAKACGKTETGRRHAASTVQLDVDERARLAADIDVGLLLDGPRPRLLDEWQAVPQLWNHVRRRVDDERRPGLFILTGSAAPPDDSTRHSGAGRFSRVRMRPMSLAESGHSTAAVSVGGLLDGGEAHAGEPALTIRDLADRCVAGGWPAVLRMPVTDAADVVGDYLDQTTRLDVPGVASARDPVRVDRLVRSLARHESTPASLATVAADTGGESPLAEDTVRGYLDALTRIMVVEDSPPWSPRLRSRSRLRATPVRRFVDPSLAAAALRAGPDRLLADPEYFGLLFESLVVRDLRAYVQPLGGDVYSYRDNTGLEVDAIVELRDGRWMAVEVKLGQSAVDTAAVNLRRLAERVDTGVMGSPSALVVVTGTGYAYRRPDGVDVVPIGALGP